MIGSTPRMSPGSRLVLAVVACLVIVIASGTGVLAAVLYRSGSVAVDVCEERGSRISLAIPTALVVAAVKLVPAEAFHAAAPELRSFWPALREAVDQLSRCPDAVLLEVQEPGETVRIAKREGRLWIDVRERGDRVHVSVPLSAVSAVLDKLDRASEL